MMIVSKIPTQTYRDHWDKIFGDKNAKHKQEAGEVHASCSTQCKVCQEGGNPTEGCKRVQHDRQE